VRGASGALRTGPKTWGGVLYTLILCVPKPRCQQWTRGRGSRVSTAAPNRSSVAALPAQPTRSEKESCRARWSTPQHSRLVISQPPTCALSARLSAKMPAEATCTKEAGVAMLLFSMASSSLLLINKLCLHYLPVPASISCLQFLVSSVTAMVRAVASGHCLAQRSPQCVLRLSPRAVPPSAPSERSPPSVLACCAAFDGEWQCRDGPL
jgi:hypothetical protein